MTDTLDSAKPAATDASDESDAKVAKSDEQWRSELTPAEYEITRKAATEAPFTGEYWNTKTKGQYLCRCCGAELFDSDTKYDSGTGWPSFYKPVSPDAVSTQEDHSLGMLRMEALCSRCDAHLGHVFPDGPEPTGARFCMNSASLKLKPEDE